ncbi:MAG: hypothetical protein ACHQ52_05375 [Candidatus Eisenbacteria bacterium]
MTTEVQVAVEDRVTTHVMAARIDTARGRLLELHRALVEVDRRAYERVHGRLTAGALLDNLIHHPVFAWLRPLSTLIAETDDRGRASRTPSEWLAAARALLTADPEGGEFQRRYAERLQRSPEVVVAHAAARRVLGR